MMMLVMDDGTEISRAPSDMDTREVAATYIAAWELAQFRPSGYLAKALANWQSAAERELRRRGEWKPESLPPYEAYEGGQ